MPTDSPAAKKLKALRVRAGFRVRPFAAALGFATHTSYAYYEDDYKERHLQLSLVEKLAAILVGRGEPPITEEEVFDLAGLATAPRNEPLKARELREAIAPHDFPNYPKDVPILGVTAAGSADEEFFINHGEEVDYVKRPPAIAKNHHVFALYVQGASMSRWRDPGNLVYVDRLRPPNIGDRVVVELLPQQEGGGHPALLKELVRRTAKQLLLKQYHPEKTIEVPMSRVIKIHRVIEWEELLSF